MAYIGNTPADKFLTLAKQNFTTSATTSYTLDSSVSSTQDIALFINSVRQSPVDAYTVSGTALTLTSATAGTDEMYCVYLGKTVGTVSPASDSIATAMIQANAVTGAKLNTDVISAQTALASEPADTDEFMVSDAGVLKRIDYSLIKASNTPAFHATKASQSINNSSSTKVTWNSEVFDSDGTFDLATNERWTPAIAGKYFVYCSLVMDGIADAKSVYCQIKKNGSTLITNQAHSGQSSSLSSLTCAIISLGDSDYVEAFVLHNHGSAINCVGGTNPGSFFGGFRIAGVG